MEPKSRRNVLKVLGTGAVAGTGAIVGLSQMSESASAEVALDFEDMDVNVHGVSEIDDLRITGDISGDYRGSVTKYGAVTFRADVSFDRFGEFSESKDFSPDTKEGTVSWQPSWSLIEETEFVGTAINPVNNDADEVSYSATVKVTMNVRNNESYLVATDTTTKSATITFDHSDPNAPEPTDTPVTGDDQEGSADVGASFTFEVDK